MSLNGTSTTTTLAAADCGRPTHGCDWQQRFPLAWNSNRTSLPFEISQKPTSRARAHRPFWHYRRPWPTNNTRMNWKKQTILRFQREMGSSSALWDPLPGSRSDGQTEDRVVTTGNETIISKSSISIPEQGNAYHLYIIR
jgi:hypothetical protein